MEIYGLTGGIGSGKSTVAGILEEYGIPVVSADELSRVVIAPGTEGLQEVVKAFGEEIINPKTRELDRKRMASLVFTDPKKRAQLEEIIHPRVRERFEDVMRALASGGHTIVVYEIPLLFEKQLQNTVSAVIVVSAREKVRIDRVRVRSGLSADDVRRRMAAQVDEQTRRKGADYIIENNGDQADLRHEVEELIVRFLKPRSSNEETIEVEVEDADDDEFEVDITDPGLTLDDLAIETEEIELQVEEPDAPAKAPAAAPPTRTPQPPAQQARPPRPRTPIKPAAVIKPSAVIPPPPRKPAPPPHPLNSPRRAAVVESEPPRPPHPLNNPHKPGEG